MARVKKCRLAGTWYPASAARLNAMLDELLAGTAPAATPIGALVVPHAGYQYSGRAAGKAYGLLQPGSVQRVVVLAPSHFYGFRGAVVPDFDAFETPLGSVEVDAAAVASLPWSECLRLDSEPFGPEHSLEIQLPFLQRVAAAVRVVPLLVGEVRDHDAIELAGAIEGLLDAGTLLVVSSDFTHYGSHYGYVPFPPHGRDAVKEKLAALDRGAIDAILAGDRRRFEDYLASTGATVCGRMPIAVFLETSRSRGRGRLVEYYTSLDVTGDYEQSVSYAAIVFAPPAEGRKPKG